MSLSLLEKGCLPEHKTLVPGPKPASTGPASQPGEGYNGKNGQRKCFSLAVLEFQTWSGGGVPRAGNHEEDMQ